MCESQSGAGSSGRGHEERDVLLIFLRVLRGFMVFSVKVWI
jgi:hypothetical protein